MKTDTDKALEILKQDILSLIVTFETNFNEQVRSLYYDNQTKNLPRFLRDIQIFLERK